MHRVLTGKRQSIYTRNATVDKLVRASANMYMERRCRYSQQMSS